MDFAAASDQRQEFLEELKNKEYAIVGIADEYDLSLGGQFSKLERGKSDVKKLYIRATTQCLLLKCLTSPPDPDSWPSTHKAVSEKALKESAEKLKNAKQDIEDIKNDLRKKCEISEKSHEEALKKKDMLEKKLEDLVDKCKLLETHQVLHMTAVSEAGKVLSREDDVEECMEKKTKNLKRTQQRLQQCQEAILEKRMELEMACVKLEKVRSLGQGLQTALQQAADAQQSLVTNATRQKERLQQRMSDLEKLSGIQLGDVGANCLTLYFVCDAPDQKEMTAEVTLMFGETDMLGFPVLTEIQTDASGLQVDDLMANPLLCINPPSLVTRLRARWLAHVPLLSEIQQLHERFAVDWVPEENCLRAMVGQGGSVVCTLAVPPTYPLSRDITLTSIQGEDIPDLTQLKPQHGSSLQEWVCFLEDEFGKP